MKQADIGIIGGGIIGLATAYRLTQRYPRLRIVLFEKEVTLAQHQTGHNSGVLHSGIYYRPGSLKAQNCRAGRAAMQAFCEQEEIAHEICGKVIVAVTDAEIPALDRLYARGQQNGVVCERIGQERLRELEPHAAGVAAIHVPEAGIVDFREVCNRLALRVSEAGGQILTGARVAHIEHQDAGLVVATGAGDFNLGLLVTCGGLHSDRLVAMGGEKPRARIVPFRGEYFVLRPEAARLCRDLIYPVPDPRLPFLGVHFTRRLDGRVECGPNAVLALAREGYRKTDVSLRDLAESLTYAGLYRLMRRYWRVGTGEMWRSLSKAAFVRALQRLVPEIEAGDLTPAPAGVRAQAVTPRGELVDDFLFQQGDRILNVVNAPSPAATSALNIANLVVDKLAPLVENGRRIPL